MPLQIIRLKETASTNDALKESLVQQDMPEGIVIQAEEQTQGRGQQGNSWVAEPGQNLTFSLLLKPVHVAAAEMFLISQVVSIGIVAFLNELGAGFTIKWPNDIYHNDQKVCGILVENQLLGATLAHSIIGVGLNVNQEEWPAALPNPLSLRQVFRRTFALSELLDGICESIMCWYTRIDAGEEQLIREAYAAYLYRKDGLYAFQADGNTFQARIVFVSPDGQLHLELENGEECAYYFKEVQFIL